MLTFQPDDTSSIFKLPLYDVSKLHVRMLYEAKSMSDELTNLVSYTSKSIGLSIRLECMIYAYAYEVFYLNELHLTSSDKNDEYSTIFKGFILHSLDEALVGIFEKYKSSALAYCDSRFTMYYRMIRRERQNNVPVNYPLLVTIFFKQPLKVIRLHDIPDDGDISKEKADFNIVDEDLESSLKANLPNVKYYLESKIEEFVGFTDV